MILFVETSAIVEYLSEGTRAPAVATVIEASETDFYISPIAIFEATSVLASKQRISVTDAREAVMDLVRSLGATNMSITPEIGEIAISAMARYGKGRGHPAQLNFGDCFSYACARAAGVPLLYVGADFAQTDLA